MALTGALTGDWEKLNKENIYLQNNVKVYFCTQIQTDKIP